MTGLVVLEKMGMLVLLMAVGFAAAKANWVGDGFNQATSRLVANVFLPASILSSVIGVAPLFSGKELAVVIAGTFVLFGLCAVGGLVVSKLVPMPKQDQLVAWLSIFFMNNVFVGFPVVQAIFGEEALFCASLTNIPFNILLFSIGVSRLPQRRHDHDPEPALRHRRHLRLPCKLPQHHPLRRHPAHHDLLPAVSAAGKTTRTEDLPCFSLRNTSA